MSNLHISEIPGAVAAIDTKRFYVPGFVVHSTCPHCGFEDLRNMGLRYLSYPEFNTPIPMTFYHETEEDSNGKSESHEWTEMIVLAISIKTVEEFNKDAKV